MARQNVAFIAFNRGLMSPKALARVDLDRTQLSAEVMTNWLPKTQGAMSIRPGTKYIGSSFNDTGAQWIEFVAATDDTALLELTDEKMRVWVDDALIGRPSVTTTTTFPASWSSSSSVGGTLSTPSPDIIPPMLAQQSDGAEVTAKSSNDLGSPDTGSDLSSGGRPWNAADKSELVSVWQDTGDGHSAMPSWWNFDLDSGDKLDTGMRESVRYYSLAANAYRQGAAPRAWRLITGNFDTGTFATDTGKWTLEDERTNEIDWGLSERRTYTLPGHDTGTVEARRHWRLHFVSTDTGSAGTTPPRFLRLANISMHLADSANKMKTVGGQITLNATAIGSLARARRTVSVSAANLNKEHSLAIEIARGPVTIRVGSAAGEDDYITNTQLGTGVHNLAFTPNSDIFITLQTDATVDRVVRSVRIGDTGTLELTTPWRAVDLSHVRYDQSADTVYVTCDENRVYKIERRGTGRSWSVVELEPTAGPFLGLASSEARLSVSAKYGNTDMSSDIPFFTAGHVGALIRQVHSGQSGKWALGAAEAVTDAVQLVGISDTGDTGTPSQESERRLDISVTGTYAGTITIERSFDGDDFGFHAVSQSGGYIKSTNGSSSPSDTGTFSRVINDDDNNVPVWYRARMSAYTSGAAVVTFTYPGLSVAGIARVTAFNNSRNVAVEVLNRFSDTGSTDVWQEGSWSVQQGYPVAVALHGGRLCLGRGATVALSASDDYENFDDTTEGDAAPILRTLGAGPVDNIYYLLSLLRLVIGTAGAEIAMRSSSLDEPVTAENSNARTFSTQGSANLRPVKMDNRGIFLQRSGRRLFQIGFSEESLESDYAVQELTSLVPDLLEPGVVSIAVQRQPDTRIHCVLADGRVAILTFDPLEDLLCWSTWETDPANGAAVERAMVLPSEQEDAVYYHIRRTINGQHKRYLERWAQESETEGDTGLTWIVDCAKSYTDTGRNTELTGFQHLAGRNVAVWSDDTGTIPGVDRSPDSVGGQTLYVVDTGGAPGLDTGTVVLVQPVHHAVVGLPYTATWKSSKLAYGAEAGTALAQMKRNDKIGFLLYQTHNNGLFFGSDTGRLDALPRTIDRGATVDADKIYETLDQVAMPFPGLWNADSRIVLRGKSPRPVTVLAAIPTVSTNEKI